MEYIYLQGSEQIQQAAHTMRHAAEDMGRAASSFYETLQQHQRFMDDWLQRFEAALEKSSSTRAEK